MTKSKINKNQRLFNQIMQVKNYSTLNNKNHKSKDLTQLM